MAYTSCFTSESDSRIKDFKTPETPVYIRLACTAMCSRMATLKLGLLELFYNL